MVKAPESHWSDQELGGQGTPAGERWLGERGTASVKGRPTTGLGGRPGGARVHAGARGERARRRHEEGPISS